MPDPDRLFRYADRLGKMTAGSEAADRAIHEVLGRTGEAPPYTRGDAAARLLLPPGFEECTVNAGVAGSIFASCRCIGMHEGRPYPDHAQFGPTFALAFCGVALRAWGVVLRS